MIRIRPSLYVVEFRMRNYIKEDRYYELLEFSACEIRRITQQTVYVKNEGVQ